MCFLASIVFLLLVASSQGKVFTCDQGDIEIPQLLIGNMTQDDLLQRLLAIETRLTMLEIPPSTPPPVAAPAEPVVIPDNTWCAPVGMMIFIDGPADCPDGFMDVSLEYAGRYVFIDQTPGTAGSPISPQSNFAPVENTMTMTKTYSDGFLDAPFVTGSGTPQVESSKVAPTVIMRACRRTQPC